MKILCPRHHDTTPSLEIYEDAGYCFVCSAVVPLDELDIESIVKPEPEDLNGKLKYIKSLSTRTIRGLQLPYDNEGFFIVWPDLSFYKIRTYEGRQRYMGPRGHRPPLFTYKGADTKVLVLVEGEINCMSLKLAYPESKVTIASFGGINNCYSYMNEYYTYDSIHVIVDKDSAGVVHGLNLKEMLLQRGKRVTLTALPQDFNDLLTTRGTNAIKEICNQEGVEL